MLNASAVISENCNLWNKNSTLIAFLKYGGIPQNIAYNILFFVVSIILILFVCKSPVTPNKGHLFGVKYDNKSKI